MELGFEVLRPSVLGEINEIQATKTSLTGHGTPTRASLVCPGALPVYQYGLSPGCLLLPLFNSLVRHL